MSVAANDYPTVIDGAPVTAADWFNPVAIDLTAVKPLLLRPTVDYWLTASQTLTVSSTTYQNITALAAAVAASATYAVDLHVFFTSPVAGDLRLQATAPVGSTFPAGIHFRTTALTQTSIAYASWLSTTRTAGGNDVTPEVVSIAGTLVTSTTAGTLQIQACQDVADPTAPVILLGSRLMLRRMA